MRYLIMVSREVQKAIHPGAPRVYVGAASGDLIVEAARISVSHSGALMAWTEDDTPILVIHPKAWIGAVQLDSSEAAEL